MRTRLNKTGLSNLARVRNGVGAQVIIEYVLMFTVIVIAIIFAAKAYIQPSVNYLFKETGDVIYYIADEFVANAFRW